MNINKKRFYVLTILLSACLIFASSFLFFNFSENVEASAVSYTLPEKISNLFTDYTCTSLADEDLSLADIEALKIQNTDAASTQFLNRAEEIIKGEIKYTSLSEFSSQNVDKNKIDQVGDLYNLVLKYNLRYPTSDLILTGIYGLSGQKIKVFVDCETESLPTLIFTQHRGYWNGGYRQEQPLQKGMNVFTYPTFSSSNIRADVKGGAIYLKNPYTSDQQGKVKVYIEGGGFYPVFKKGDDEAEFLGKLQEYETRRLQMPSQMLNMAELATDHTIISTTSSSLYENYITYKTISPTENLTLWGQFMTNLLEFNGIATSPESPNGNWTEMNDYMNINFRYMSEQADSGAYTTRYHIGFYYEHNWFANFKADILNQYVYNIVHEVGHQIDTQSRAIDETTNNMTATYAYLVLLNMPVYQKWQPFDRGFNYLSSDNTLNTNAFREGHILYPADNIKDRNYMIWWYLESAFPGFWANLNNAYRNTSVYGITANEKMVYLSSLVTGVDLSEYYERWGYFQDTNESNKFRRDNTSENFKNLMSNPKIKKQYSHFWLVDNAEYDFMKNNSATNEQEKLYSNATPEITSVERTDSGIKIMLINKKSLNHLGYEIYVSTDGESGEYKLAGFTYSNTFVDTFDYAGKTPTYKALAVNRFFKTTEFSESAQEGEAQAKGYVCRVGTQNFATLEEGMIAVTKDDTLKGKTLYILDDCFIDKFEFYPEVNIEVDGDLQRDITITCGNDYMFKSNYHFSLKGRQNARIIIEGGSINREYGVFLLGSGNDLFEYVTFQNCKTKDRGGAIYQIFGNVTLKNCEFVNCSSVKDNCAIYFQTPSDTKVLNIFNCKFANDCTDIYFQENTFNITFDSSVPTLTLGSPALDKDVILKCKNFSASESDLSKISFAGDDNYISLQGGDIKIGVCNFLLTFIDGEKTYQYNVNSKNFTFGSESLSGFDDKKFISSYFDQSSSQSYSPGEEITLTEDKTFWVTSKDKFTISFYSLQGTTTEYYAENEVIYLPLFDSVGNKIYKWIDEENLADNNYYAGEGFVVKKDLSLRADYFEYFGVQFVVNGEVVQFSYKKYGDSLTAPTCDLPDFKSWHSGNKIVRANQSFEVDKDLTFVATFDDGKIYNLIDAQIEILSEDLAYTGNQIVPKIRVTLNGETLEAYLYRVEYKNNVNAGLATITIKPLSDNVFGEKSINFDIARRILSERDVQISNILDQTYDGQVKYVSSRIIWGGKILTLYDYDITYLDDQINAGTVRFSITFKGNFSGMIEKSFTILQAEKPSVTSTSIYVDYEVNTLADIKPPENFVWVNEKQEINSNEIFAYARYIGPDAKNYKTIDILFKITIEKKVEPTPPDPPNVPDSPNQPDTPNTPDDKPNKESNPILTIILLVTIIPTTTFAGIWISVVIVRHKRKKNEKEVKS